MIERIGSPRLLKRLMAPQPFVLKDLLETQFSEPIEDRAKIVHDMLRAIVIVAGGEAPVDVAARPEASSERLDCSARIHQMLKDIHRGDKIEGGRGQRRLLQVDKSRLAPTLRESMLAEGQHHTADIR